MGSCTKIIYCSKVRKYLCPYIHLKIFQIFQKNFFLKFLFLPPTEKLSAFSGDSSLPDPYSEPQNRIHKNQNNHTLPLLPEARHPNSFSTLSDPPETEISPLSKAQHPGFPGTQPAQPSQSRFDIFSFLSQYLLPKTPTLHPCTYLN